MIILLLINDGNDVVNDNNVDVVVDSNNVLLHKCGVTCRYREGMNLYGYASKIEVVYPNSFVLRQIELCIDKVESFLDMSKYITMYHDISRQT